MIISKMIFNEAAVFKEILLGEYALHQAVWDLFGDNPERKRDFLYRMETIGTMPLIYSVSARNPQDAKGVWQIQNKQYTPQVKAGMRFGFTVRVNPTVKKDGKRHDVVMDTKCKKRSENCSSKNLMQEIVSDACGRWMQARSGKNGFNLLQFRADGYRQVQFYKTKGSMPIRYSVVDITGTLEVVEEGAFTRMLFEGLGSEKGFGCGLMLVKKI